MNELLFDGDYWVWKALEDFIAFKEIHAYVNNQLAMNAYKSSMSYIALEPDMHEEGTELEHKNRVESTLRNSLDHFASQTLVSLCTTYEVAVRQFFKCLFVKHPICMHDFIGHEQQKGIVLLKDIIKAGNYSDVIKGTAEQASGAASKGKYGRILGRASNLCKYEIETDMIDSLNLLQSKRNKIVHEKNIESLIIEDIGKAHILISKAIESLCYMALEKNVPGNYTYIKPETVVLKSVAFLKFDVDIHEDKD